MSTASFAEEYAALHLGDKRRNDRAVAMVEKMIQHPSGSIPETFGTHAEAKAVYRFLSSEAFETHELQEALQEACRERVCGERMVLAIQDTMNLEFPSSPALAEAADGLWVHSTLAVSAEGIPLGLLHQQRWTRPAGREPTAPQRRERALQDKESHRWLQALQAVHTQLPGDTVVLTVTDREGDMFEMFAEPRPPNSELLIRAGRNRRVAEAEKYVFAAAQAAPLAGECTVLLRRRPDRPARVCRLQVRFRELELQVPRNGRHDPGLQPQHVTALWVQEVHPASGHEPVQRLLLTTLPVPDLQAAWQCVCYYTLRWLIERFHYTLKSGCRLEDSQLRSQEALQRLLVLYCAVAWRLLWMTYAARRHSTQPCTVAFSPVEWQVLYRLRWGTQQPLPAEPPTLGEAVRWLARLGGFLDRRGDGEPGVKVLWRGLMHLHDIVIGVHLAHRSPEVLGNA
jgi:hypothetical protein